MRKGHEQISRFRWMARTVVMIVILATGFAAQGAAGLIIERADGSVEYFGDNAVCSTSPEGVYSVIRDGRILMVFKPSGKYWLGSAADWCNEMQKMMGDMADMMHGTPAPYTLKKVGVETVGGRPATRYSIMLDGESVHDIWVNEETDVMGKIRKLESAMDYMECGDTETLFEMNGMDLQPAVTELEKKGLIVKRQDPYGEEDDPYEGETVTAIRFGEIPADKLSMTPPAGLKAADNIMSLFGGM